LDSSLNLHPLNITDLLHRHGLHAKKGLGQNFLADHGALQKIAAAAEIPPNGLVLEVGPGLGSLTRHLASAAGEVIAVELDAGMLPVLEEVLAPWRNVRIVQGDILEQDPALLVGNRPYIVVANIPYYITSAVIRHLLEAAVQPTRMVLTMQLEVAQRICARPGDLSLLALSVQVYGTPRIAVRIPAGAFVPAPKVDSAALRIDLLDEPRIPAAQLDCFFHLARAGFQQKRKTLRNSLSSVMREGNRQSEALLIAAEIDPQRRAESLSIEEWGRLTACAVKMNLL
jgi:16S rRNA (adenine1518-N6/adenine1519-N6)-dimethyltransferase